MCGRRLAILFPDSLREVILSVFFAWLSAWHLCAEPIPSSAFFSFSFLSPCSHSSRLLPTDSILPVACVRACVTSMPEANRAVLRRLCEVITKLADVKADKVAECWGMLSAAALPLVPVMR